MRRCFTRLYCVAGSAWLLAAAAGRLAAQSGGASLAGTIRSQEGSPLVGAFIVVGQRRTNTDSLGRYQIDSLEAGGARVIARRIGFSARDSTIVFTAGARVRWDIVLRSAVLELSARQVSRDGDDAKSGRIDSIARRLITPTPDRSLPLGTFGAHLFAAVAAGRGPDSNTVLSPLSAGMALSLVRFGARGTTAIALDSVLAMSTLDREAIEERGAEMMAALARRTDVILSAANAIWVDTSIVLTPGFRASTSRWRTVTSSMPLGTQSAVDAINRWADSATHQKIPTILSNPLSDTTRLFIANAVYFKGKWLEPFEKSATSPGEFTLASGAHITVPRMTRLGHMAYHRARGYQTIRLPYRTGKVAMYVVLPDTGVSFDRIVSDLRSASWLPSIPLEDSREVHVVLPRFHAELTLDLRDPLETLGAKVAFDCDSADFWLMARPRSERDRLPLCISKAAQKVYIDVDEEGTEAAAVTGFQMVTITGYSPPIEFIVDRPFLFVLRDESTGTDLFLGRIVRP